MYILHSLHRHAPSFRDLINFLNLLKELLHLISFGTSSQIFGQNILRTLSHSEQFLCFLLLIDYYARTISKMFFIISGAIPFLIMDFCHKDLQVF